MELRLELASEEERKRKGGGWEIEYGYGQSPYGTFLAAQCPRGLCHLSFPDPGEEKEEENRLRKFWPEALLRRDDEWAQRFVAPLLDLRQKTASRSSVQLLLCGTPFQVRVWQALVKIPSGRVVSYGEIAASLGKPTASRAVGAAVGDNAIACLIPCHRVVRADGGLGGYRWGVERKRAMLADEGVTLVT